MAIPTPTRRAAAQAVVDAWDAEQPEVGDPEFWTNSAAHDERLAQAYRELANWHSQDPALRKALADAERYRRGQADDARRKLADALEGTR